ncbi:MAG: hypothetical protein J3T61_09965 [Candidatus Brocadiales bacterium]|nr:hypothetical protein [Candidatus Bathyanammoxibius sp.]
MSNYYVVCTCELGHPDPTNSVMDCPMHGEPQETVTEVSGDGELFIDMSKEEK